MADKDAFCICNLCITYYYHATDFIYYFANSYRGKRGNSSDIWTYDKYIDSGFACLHSNATI